MRLTDNDKKEIKYNACFVAWNKIQKRIEALQEQGITLKEIADIIGMSPRTLYRLLSTPQNFKSMDNTSVFFKHFMLIASLQYMGKYLPKKTKRKYKRRKRKD